MKRFTSSIGVLLLSALALAPGCTNGRGEEKARSAQAAQVRQESTPRYETLVVPAGTDIVVSLETRLVTDTNHAGDPFVVRTVNAIVVDGKTVAPANTRITGVLRDVQASGKIKGRAQMTLAFLQIEDSSGKTQAISAQPLTLQADSKTGGDVEKIAAGGAVGAVIGGIAGGQKGAAIGAGAGAGAGTILMLATKGDEVELNPGDKLNVHLTSSTSIKLIAKR